MPAQSDPGTVSASIVMDPHPSRHDLNNLFPLHELIAKCLLLSNSSWQAVEWPRADPWQISHAFCTFLQGCSRHRLSLSQISQDLTAAVRRLHYVPIWLMFALTCLLTPTSFPPPDPPQSIAAIRRAETLTNELWERDDLNASRCPPTPVTTKRVSRRWHAGCRNTSACKCSRERFTDVQRLHHVAFVSGPFAEGREITPGCWAVNCKRH